MSGSDGLLPPGALKGVHWPRSGYVKGGEGREVFGGVGRSWTGR